MSDLELLFAEAENIITDGSAKLRIAEDFELVGLEQKIETLCGRVVLESPEIQQNLVPRLTAILENLTMLGTGLKQAMGDVPAIPVHKAANVAYKVADSRDNFGKRDSDG